MPNKTAKSIEEVNDLLIGSRDFKSLAEKASFNIIQELSLPGCVIFRVDTESKQLRAYAFSSQIAKDQLAQVIEQPFRSMTTPIDEPVNLMGKTAAIAKSFTGQSMQDFIVPTVSSQVASKVQAITEMNHLISLPVKIENQVLGALLLGKKDREFSSQEIVLLKTFTNQLGLAMNNIIAHEKLIDEYRRHLADSDRPLKKSPCKKFTLRIDEDLEQYLAWQAQQTGLSKAEFVRQLLTNHKQSDSDFRNFTS
ncbi:GAF domain-containing protein [Patescibacteria group bacterium]